MLACGAKKMVTTNGYWRSGQKINAKANADKACMLCANAGLTIDDVFVVDRMVDFEVPYITYRDTALSKELMLDEISDYCPAEKMDAEDPLFIMYTSGSTGSPKGTLHTTAGYMVYTYTTFKYIFDYKDCLLYTSQHKHSKYHNRKNRPYRIGMNTGQQCNHITQECKRYTHQDRIDTVKKNMRY